MARAQCGTEIPRKNPRTAVSWSQQLTITKYSLSRMVSLSATALPIRLGMGYGRPGRFFLPTETLICVRFCDRGSRFSELFCFRGFCFFHAPSRMDGHGGAGHGSQTFAANNEKKPSNFVVNEQD